MRLLQAVLLAMAVWIVSPPAIAAEYTLILHEMDLEPLSVTPHVGDLITFDNRSDMTHNLYVTYSDGSVDNLDTQTPGMQRKLTVRVAGPATIRCWIHPIIRLDVDIAP